MIDSFKEKVNYNRTVIYRKLLPYYTPEELFEACLDKIYAA